MIAPLTERTEGISTGGTDAHRRVRLHHHRHTAAQTRTIHHVRHQVQTRLQQETIIACKLVCAHQKFHLLYEQTDVSPEATFRIRAAMINRCIEYFAKPQQNSYVTECTHTLAYVATKGLISARAQLERVLSLHGSVD